MGQKMKYDLTAPALAKEAAQFDTCVRLSGGFNLEKTNIVTPSIPSLAPLYLDYATRKAYPIVNVKVQAAYTDGDTALTIKIEKGSNAYAGMFIGSGTKGAEVESIDKTNTAYDELTIKAKFGANISKGAILFEASAVGGTTLKRKANALNYAYTKVEDGATLTGIASIYEIYTSKIPTLFSTKDKEELGARFLFID